MTGEKALEYWSVWYPQAASTGLLFARGRLDATGVLLVHSAPPVVTVEITDPAGRRLAYSADLPRTQESPMCLLRRSGGSVLREDLWLDGSHHGLPVLLPGGEVGILTGWWHAGNRREWRWQVEFYNQLG